MCMNACVCIIIDAVENERQSVFADIENIL